MRVACHSFGDFVFSQLPVSVFVRKAPEMVQVVTLLVGSLTVLENCCPALFNK